MQRVTKRALAEPFLVPSPNAGVLEASFDLPTVDCEVLGQVGELSRSVVQVVFACLDHGRFHSASSGNR